MKLDKITLDKDNRMLRIGFGKNKGLYFLELIFGLSDLELKNKNK